MSKIFNIALDALKSGFDLMGVKIISSSGSVPRKSGAVMFVKKDGSTFGTIGGGALEKYCISAALQDFGSDFVREFDLSSSSATEQGFRMICGGGVRVEFKYFDHRRSYEQNLRGFLGSAASNPRAVIFGAGHVAGECVKVLDYLGFDVVVYDCRSDFAKPERHRAAREVICAAFDEIDEHLTITSDDYVMVMTHGHKHDEEVLLSLLRHKCKYTGCIGSRNKMKEVRSFLLKNGISDDDISRIHSPIGLEIAAQSPEEIAISVAAEIILLRNKS